MKGFYDRILRVDVTKKDYHVESIEDAFLQKYLGGKGLATHLLLKHNPPRVDPLAPENILILTTNWILF